MTHTSNRSPAPLRDVLYELSLAKEVPDPDLLDDFVRHYPEYAVPLTDFAIELVVDYLRRGQQKETVVSATSVSPAVSRAISTFHNALYANRTTQATSAARSAADAVPAADPFARLDRKAFRDMAQALGVNSVFLCKLRDRVIDLVTIPQEFLRFLAERLQLTTEALAAYFGSNQRGSTQPQFFKADQKPKPGRQQTFEEAVRSSGLTEEQQRHLLSF
jgi:hypothetical protein